MMRLQKAGTFNILIGTQKLFAGSKNKRGRRNRTLMMKKKLLNSLNNKLEEVWRGKNW